MALVFTFYFPPFPRGCENKQRPHNGLSVPTASGRWRGRKRATTARRDEEEEGAEDPDDRGEEVEEGRRRVGEKGR